MNTLILDNLDIAVTRAWHSAGRIHLQLADGRTVSVRADITPALAEATQEQRKDMRILPFSIHWPGLDEDITIETLLKLGVCE